MTIAVADGVGDNFDRIEIDVEEVEVNYTSDATGEDTWASVARAIPTIVVQNRSSETVVGMFQVLPGIVNQVRVHPTSVRLVRLDGGVVELLDRSRPSQSQTGWKIVPEDFETVVMTANELTGFRANFNFGEHLHQTGNGRYVMRPTVSGVAFEVNPASFEPGVFVDELVVVLRPGASRAEFDSVLAEIRGRVIRDPQFSTGYHIEFPPTITIGEAYQRFGVLASVAGILPSVNMGFFNGASSHGGITAGHESSFLPGAWDAACSATGGGVGSRRLRVALIDSGFVLDSPIVAGNVAINTDELPPALFDFDRNGTVEPSEWAPFDSDGNGVLTVSDLRATGLPLAADGAPVATVSGGRTVLSALDLLADPRWLDGDPGSDQLVDDIVGWDFARGTNNPTADTPQVDPSIAELIPIVHGVGMAHALAADGVSALGPPGAVWDVALIPIRVGGIPRTAGDDAVELLHSSALYDALVYAETLEPDVILFAGGYVFLERGAELPRSLRDRGGSDRVLYVTKGVPHDDFDAAVEQVRGAFLVEPFIDPSSLQPASRSLYIIAAGNDSVNLGQQGALHLPGSSLMGVLPEHTLLVGGANGTGVGIGTRSTRTSSYDPNHVMVPVYGSTWEVWDPFASVYKPLGGSSGGSATVAGTAILTIAANPILRGDPISIRRRIVAATDPWVEVLESSISGVNPVASRGPMVNANAAVTPP